MLYQLSYASLNGVSALYQSGQILCTSKFFRELIILKSEKPIDARGLICPEPLMLLKKAVREADDGDEVSILSDDPVSLRDIPAFCKFMNHELVSVPDDAHPFLFVVRK